jgi:hypothetical protein
MKKKTSHQHQKTVLTKANDSIHLKKSNSTSQVYDPGIISHISENRKFHTQQQIRLRKTGFNFYICR